MNKVIIFVKAPVPGKVKTRLSPPLSQKQSAVLYSAFAQDTVAMVRKAVKLEEMEIAYASRKPYLNLAWLDGQTDIPYFLQKGRTLGDRLIQAFNRAFRSGASKVVVLGSDTPHLYPSAIREAWNALDQEDLVIGPAEDLGYYLIGLRRPAPGLFTDMPWSTPEVLGRTLERARKYKMSIALLSPCEDVDEPLALEQLVMEIKHAPRRSLVHTRRALRELSLSNFRVGV